MKEAEATDTSLGYVEGLDVVETVAKSCHAQYPEKIGIRSLNDKYTSLKKSRLPRHKIDVLSSRIQESENLLRNCALNTHSKTETLVWEKQPSVKVPLGVSDPTWQHLNVTGPFLLIPTGSFNCIGTQHLHLLFTGQGAETL